MLAQALAMSMGQQDVEMSEAAEDEQIQKALAMSMVSITHLCK